MKFTYFGCWNNLNCEDKVKYNYRDIILDYINQFEKDSKMMVISGDNWYSTQKADAKYYFTNILHTGLYKLYNIGKPCHIILGNHDEAIDNDKSPNALKKNCMLNTEKHYLNRILKGIDVGDAVPSLEDLRDLRDLREYTKTKKTRKSHLMSPQSDSAITLYESREQIDYTLYDKKYLFIFLNTNIFDEGNEDTIANYITKLDSTLKENAINAKTVMVVGHNPITSLKIKKNVQTHTLILENTELFDRFVGILNHYNAVYLCADTHNFQISNISTVTGKNVLQVIVGTAGASPDLLPDINVIDYSINDYKVAGFAHNSYGFCTIELADDIMTVTYNHILNDNNYFIYQAYIYKVNLLTKLITPIQSSKPLQHLQKDIIINDNNIRAAICQETDTDKNLVFSNKDKNIKCYKKTK